MRYDPPYVPPEMASLKRWVSRGGADLKRPFGKANDSSTWKSLDEALKERGGKVSFALSEEDDLMCLDLDNCFIAPGVIHPGVKQILKLVPTYTEISMSGKGLHVFGRAALPFSGRKSKGGIEIYGSKKFIAFSGNVLDDEHREIRNIQEGVNRMVAKIFPPKTEITNKMRSDKSPLLKNCSDTDLIRRIRKSRSSEKFEKLFSGDTSGSPTPSEATFALLGILKFWCSGDPAQMRRIFEMSELCDAKWFKRDAEYGDHGGRCIYNILNR
jgi:putative DNA primase/helicase